MPFIVYHWYRLYRTGQLFMFLHSFHYVFWLKHVYQSFKVHASCTCLCESTGSRLWNQLTSGHNINIWKMQPQHLVCILFFFSASPLWMLAITFAHITLFTAALSRELEVTPDHCLRLLSHEVLFLHLLLRFHGVRDFKFLSQTIQHVCCTAYSACDWPYFLSSLFHTWSHANGPKLDWGCNRVTRFAMFCVRTVSHTWNWVVLMLFLLTVTISILLQLTSSRIGRLR